LKLIHNFYYTPHSRLQIHFGLKVVGTGLLKYALQRCVTAADLIAGRALIVHAVHAEAAAFWRRRGFIPSKRLYSLKGRSAHPVRLPTLQQHFVKHSPSLPDNTKSS
jgi:hypothetical protein